MTVAIERRLAAILSADVVGYSRLMGDDESGTLECLKAHRRELIDPRIAEHHGRIVKLMGDGALVEFASVVDAVQCAAEIQDGMAERNADVPPEQRIEFRIGINLGDVIVEDDDIYGDGINVAARLEALAEPGGICISDVVHRSVHGKVDLGFDDLGPRRVKNIAEPVHALRVRTGGSAAGPQRTLSPSRPRRLAPLALALVLLTAAGALAWRFYIGPLLQERAFAAETELPLPDKPSIAVLPFNNLSADPDQGYFSDGITESVITDLSQVSGLFVIARNTAFTYKGQPVNVLEVGRELGVRYVLEGSVQRANDRVRITAQLIDAATGFHVWADRYDRELEDVFELQDEVAEHIVSELEIELTEAERDSLEQRYTDSVEAYDMYLRGLEHYWQFSSSSTAQARVFFERAIELDPEFALAYASLAMTYSGLGGNLTAIDPVALHGRAFALAQRAVELDESLPQVHLLLGNIYQQRREHARALDSVERAITIDPNHADGYAVRGDILNSMGEPAAALRSLEQAIRLNPRFPYSYLSVMGDAQFLLGRYREAIETFRESLERNPNNLAARLFLTAAYVEAGRISDAEWQVAELLTADPDMSLRRVRDMLPYQHPADLEPVLDGLRRAGLPDGGERSM